jgi:CubicO group peptidase (beta-lactamase class C family)
LATQRIINTWTAFLPPQRKRLAVLLVLSSLSCQVTSQVSDVEQSLAPAFEAAAQIEGMKSLLVARHGQLIGERYYNGAGPDSPHDVRSVTKSFLSALVGIAIDKGYLESVEQTLGDLFADVVDSLDEEKAAITLENLLTMSAGQDWHELGGESEFNEWMNSPNQVEYVLEKPMVNTPGTVFNYSDGGAHLISVILTEATGMDPESFAAEHLFAPLGIDRRSWLVDKQGYAIGGVGLQVTPRDMVAFGTLYLNDGTFERRRVISEEWVRTSTAVRILTDNAVPYGTAYGYLWWRGVVDGYPFYMATGYGGQFIVNVPDLDLVVVATCDWWYPRADAGEHWYDIIRVIVNDVVPAVD